MARKPSREDRGHVCPFCFNDVDFDRIHYQCTNPSCTERFLKGPEGGEPDRYRSGRGDREIDPEKTVFLGRDPAGGDPVTTDRHIIRNASGRCDICNRTAYLRLCPVCHNPIPQGAEEEGGAVFVILGPKGVGKSHYIAVLIDRLRNSFAAEFGATLTAATDDTSLIYRDTYYRRLFEEGRKLAPTPSFEDDARAREPMIYYLRFLGGDRPRTYTLAFFDTAGEDLISSNRILGLNLNSFISRAAGIVFLVDPLQIPYVNKRIHVEGKPEPGEDVTAMLANIAEIIRLNRRMRPRDPIDIPLAVALTKSDVLMKAAEDGEEEKVLFGLNFAVNIERERGRYDRTNFEQVSAETEEYLRRVISDGFIQTVRQFRDHSYFAVSALGSNPAGEMLNRGVSPMRVEDPFIWLMEGDRE